MQRQGLLRPELQRGGRQRGAAEDDVLLERGRAALRPHTWTSSTSTPARRRRAAPTPRSRLAMGRQTSPRARRGVRPTRPARSSSTGATTAASASRAARRGLTRWGVDSTVYQVRLPCVQALRSRARRPRRKCQDQADVECKSSVEWRQLLYQEKCAAACAAKDGCEHDVSARPAAQARRRTRRAAATGRRPQTAAAPAAGRRTRTTSTASRVRLVEDGGRWQEGTGSWSTTPGYTYHQGAAQPHEPALLGTTTTGAPAKAPSRRRTPVRRVPGGLQGEPGECAERVGGRRRPAARTTRESAAGGAAVPQGPLLSSSCPCMPTTSLTVYKSGYQTRARPRIRSSRSTALPIPTGATRAPATAAPCKMSGRHRPAA